MTHPAMLMRLSERRFDLQQKGLFGWRLFRGDPIFSLLLGQQFSQCLPLHLVGGLSQQLSIVLKILAMDEFFHCGFPRVATNKPLT
jgi:hypothetical protein